MISQITLAEQSRAVELMHGWAIAQRIQQISRDLLRVHQGLCIRRCTASTPGLDHGRVGRVREQAAGRFYSPMKDGRRQLAVELSKWERLSAGVNLLPQRT
jgi:hypothetical protein